MFYMFRGFSYGTTHRLVGCWETVVVVTAGCASRQTVFIPGDYVNYVVFDWERVHALLTNLIDCVLTNCYPTLVNWPTNHR